MTYEILSVVKKDTTLTFTFDDGTKSTQTLHDVPVEGQEEYLNKYAEAYLAGLAIEQNS